MPINLRYGQQAVARGFLNKQRLDQILAKQRQLADQGKKVSVRMILEKAKLLNKEQLSQIDRDLNIKVVKKHTGRIQKPGVRPAGPTGAQNFAGEAVPQFSGMQGADPDATVFSPPPADMQDKIRAERERTKGEQRRKQEQEASAFFGDDGGSPFGGDPFGGEMAPEPAGFGDEMSPEPMGEMQPEPFDGGYAEMQPMGGDPFGGDDLSPQPAGFDDDGGFGNEPVELDRMDSSPKLASLGAEYDGFANPEDEELPTIGAGFDDDRGFDAQPAQQWGNQAPQYDSGPALAPSGGDDFDSFGNDIRSPEELESAPARGGTKPIGADMDVTMFSPPPPGVGGPRQKTGAMDRTVFSPRPPEFGGRPQSPQPMEAEPAGDDWGDEPAMEPAGFDDDFGADAAAPNMDATLFSPPPTQMPPARKATGPVSQRGRQGDDDFGDVEFPQSGQRIDDVPTAPASMEDEIHPLRRGVGTSSAGVKRTSRKQRGFDEDVADELPSDAGVDVPDDVPDEMPEEGVPPVGKGKGKLPGKAPLAAKSAKRELPQKEVPSTDKPEKKGAGKRVLLIFTLLLLVFVAVLVLPIVLEEQVPEVGQLRHHEQAEPIYDYVDFEIMDRIREWTGQPTKRPKVVPPAVDIPTRPPNNSVDSPPPPNGGEGGSDGEEPPADD
ncbi:MAG: hypothetical protein K8I27_08105 [Planctomycetes bacterium]|nr:hypothetical protein [Planctomycetota bacterium]